MTAWSALNSAAYWCAACARTWRAVHILSRQPACPRCSGACEVVA